MKALLVILALLFFTLSGDAHAQARNAAFTNPNAVSNTSGNSKTGGVNTVVADPATIDAGETLVNVARRITVFFYNGFRGPVQIQELTLNADGNVRSKVMSDDCKTLKNLPVSDRCSIAIEITPSSPGPWSVELLLNHSGQGRIARAEVTGTTLGKADEKSEGLAISKKIAAPLDFGEVKVMVERAARTMLIENDSTEPLLISKIDLIADTDDLQLRDVGCKEGDELKPGESCPVTVMWAPQESGNVATDLLINHSGNLGFVVVPIRGKASSGDENVVAEGGKNGAPRKNTAQKQSRNASSNARGNKQQNEQETSRPSQQQLDSLPVQKADLPPQKLPETPLPQDIAKELTPIKSTSVLPQKKKKTTKQEETANAETPEEASAEEAEEDIVLPIMTLIGTIGSKAILGDEDGQSHVVSLGDKINIAGIDVELVQLESSRAVISMKGRREELRLRTAPSIMRTKTTEESGSDVGASAGGERSSSKKSSRKSSSSSSKASSSGAASGASSSRAVNTNTSGAGDGSAPASSSQSNSGAASSSDGAASSSTGVPSSMTVQDVLNMMN